MCFSGNKRDKKFQNNLKYIKSHPIYITGKVNQFTYATGNGPEGSVRAGGTVTENNKWQGSHIKFKEE